MRRSKRCYSLGMLGVVLFVAGCGDPSDGVGDDVVDTVIDVGSVPATSLPGSVGLGRLLVADGCAEVRLADDMVWGQSCLEPDIEVVAVTSQTIDGVELALLRFMPVVELVSVDPASVRFEQSEGWALVESPTPDFTMTFRQGGVEEQAVCIYNPFFIDCDVVAAG